MADNKTKEVIIIKVADESSAPIMRIRKQMSSLDKSMKSTSKSAKSMSLGMGRLSNMFKGLVAAMGVREIARSIDSFQLLQDRLRALLPEGTNVEQVFQNIAVVARDTKQSIGTLADGYARLAVSATDAGVSSDELLDITKALTQTLRISGASTAEVNSVFLQFSQSVGLGRLQGQELRAVLLGNAKYASLLAKEYGVTRGELRKLGEEGKLVTARNFKALKENLGALNDQAAKLRITIGQSLTVAMDAMRLKFDALNKSFDITGAFATGMTFIIENIDRLTIGLGALIAGKYLSKASIGITQLGVAVKTTFKAMIVPAAIATIVGLVGELALKLKAIRDIKQEAEDAAGPVAKMSLEFVELSQQLKDAKAAAAKGTQGSMLEYLGKYGTEAAADITKLTAKTKKLFKTIREIRKEEKNYLGSLKGMDSGKNKFAELNKQFEAGTLSAQEFANKLKAVEIKVLDEKMQSSSMTILDYTLKVDALNKKFEKMATEVDKIKNKDSIFAGIQMGAEQTLRSIGSVADQVAGVTNKAFGHLEDALVNFTKTGKANFREFVTAILDDINRMVIRMSIIKPLAGAIAGGGTTTANANGNAFQRGNVIPFATGGVVSSPTTFGMTGGRTGLMGEKGPEAILPLSRGPGGKLGVSGSGTTVNVINNSNAEIETSKSTDSSGAEQIDVYIVNKVGEAMGEGKFDKSFQQLYGLNRKGQ